MLDFRVHQAAGLQGLSQPQGAQLLAMVCHGDDPSELPLLWRLCAAYLEMGYTVTVLDGTAQETANSPGLAQLLETGYWPAGQKHPETAWQMLPAALGLQDLQTVRSGKLANWRKLGALFAQDAVVVVYSKPETLASFFRGSGIKPLLAVSSSKNALLSSYLALKRLLLEGHLEPTIVNVSPPVTGIKEIAQPLAASSLIACAREFLGYPIRMVELAPSMGGTPTQPNMLPLASRLLETSLCLNGPNSMGLSSAPPNKQGANGCH